MRARAVEPIQPPLPRSTPDRERVGQGRHSWAAPSSMLFITDDAGGVEHDLTSRNGADQPGTGA
jgi:hypothetical protein